MLNLDVDDFIKRWEATQALWTKAHETYRNKTRIEVAEIEANFVGTKKQIEAKIEETKTRLKEEERNAKQAAQNAENELTEELRKALAEDAGLKYGSKVESLVWSRAWDEGHSAGYNEVVICYRNQADFVIGLLDAVREDEQSEELEGVRKRRTARS